MFNVRLLNAFFSPLLIILLLAAKPASASPAERAQESIEVIEISGQRNHLRSNRLVSNNTHFTSLDTNDWLKPTIANWLVQTPGLSLNGQGGLLQSYSIRGFSRWRVLTEVDGIPIYTDRRAGNSASFISGALLSGFDVQKGPSSTLYGSDAIGGVITLNTLDFDQKFVAISGQSNDQHKEFTAAYGTSSWQTAVNYRHANNANSADDVSLNTQFEQVSLLNKGRFSVNEWEVNLTWLPSVGKDIGKSASNYPDDRITFYPDDTHSLLLAEVSDKNNWYAKAFHHYQNWDTDVTRVGSRRNLTEYQAHTLGASLLTSRDVLEGEARVGIDWVNRQGVSIKEAEFDVNNVLAFSTPLVDAQQHNAAVFSDIHWQFAPFSVAVGARYDYISQRQFIPQALSQTNTSDHAYNASVLIGYQLNNTTRLQGEIATGFRFPTLSERFFEGETPRGTTKGNPTLNAEESTGVQINFITELTPNLSVELSGYYYQVDNYIERYDIDDTVTSYRNLNKADITGIESILQWQPSQQWHHSLRYQWQQGEDAQHNTLSDIQAPQWQLTTQWYGNHLNVRNTLSYRQKETHVSAQEKVAQSFVNWELFITTAIAKNTELSLWGSNLLDRVAPTTADEDAPSVVGPNVGIKLLHQF